MAETATPGVTAPLALTTPFVQQGDCASIWDVTYIDLGLGSSAQSPTALVSDAEDPRFTACQPSGWADRVLESRFSFSPAVCPSAWTYYGMSETIQIIQGTASTYSTAYCCARGFTPYVSLRSFTISSIDDACISIVTAGQPPITALLDHGTNSGSKTALTSATLLHQAWHVSWEARDRSTLSPSLPTLTSSKYIASWVPGQTVAPGEGDHAVGSEAPLWAPLMKFVMIGIPIIGVVIIVLAVGCCVWYRKTKKRRRAAPLPATHVVNGLEPK